MASKQARPTDDAFAAMAAKLAALEAENEALKAKNGSQGTITARVGPSGGISVYGLQRNPVTLYGNQWDRFFATALNDPAWRTLCNGGTSFGEEFSQLVDDSLQGATLASGRKAGNAAHQQRVRDAEARRAARNSR